MNYVGVPLDEYTKQDFQTVCGELRRETATDVLSGEQYPITFIVVKDGNGVEHPFNVDDNSVRVANRRDKETVV